MKSFKYLTEIIQYILSIKRTLFLYIFLCFGPRPSALKELIKRVSWLVLRSAAAILSSFWLSLRSCKQICYEKGKKEKKVWRIRASIPAPPACKAGALPFELIPQSCLNNQTKQNKNIIEYMSKEERSKLTLFLSTFFT